MPPGYSGGISILMTAPESFTILNVTLDIATRDTEFLEEFASVFGGRRAVGFGGLPRQAFSAQLDRIDDSTGELIVRGDGLADPAAFLAGFSTPTVPLRAAPASDGWSNVCLGDDEKPMFSFRGDVCRFRLVGRWRRVLAHFLFLRMLALRNEALFFHAGSVGVGGNGILLIGPKSSGKSTISLGLAARGHTFLGDETAAYVPSTRSLLPFARPAGIKPGPRSTAVSDLLNGVTNTPDVDGMLRVDPASLLRHVGAEPVPLRAVVFLNGFGEEPALERIQPGRDEVSAMQPIATTLSTAPAPARVFQMIQLLSSVVCYKMTAGTPDQTIDTLERVVLHEPNGR